MGLLLTAIELLVLLINSCLPSERIISWIVLSKVIGVQLMQVHIQTSILNRDLRSPVYLYVNLIKVLLLAILIDS